MSIKNYFSGFILLTGIAGIMSLMVLAFERFLMITRPFRAADLTVNHSCGLVLLIWVFSFMLTGPPLFGWASYGLEGPRIR